MQVQRWAAADLRQVRHVLPSHTHRFDHMLDGRNVDGVDPSEPPTIDAAK